MKLFLTDNYIESHKKIIERINLVFPDVEGLKFDGEFYRFRQADALYAFGNYIYTGDDLDINYDNLSKKTTQSFFSSNNSDFWLTATDLGDALSELKGLEVFLAETTEEQGFEFGNKVIEAYMSEKERSKSVKLPKGIPDSVVVFDPLIGFVGNIIPYLKGMDKAEKSYTKEKPIIYMFATDMQKQC